MEKLTPEQINDMFRDFKLEREEDRESLRGLVADQPETDNPNAQLFIRIVASTGSDEENDDAKLA